MKRWLGPGLALALAASCNSIAGIEEPIRQDGTDGTGGDGSGGTGNTGPGPEDFGCDAEKAPLCQEYCDTIMTNCTDDLLQYPDGSGSSIGQPGFCLGFCCALPIGTPGANEGNSVACRLTHANAAAGIERESECPIAGPTGSSPSDGDVCGTACDGYCSAMLAVCADEFPSRQACLDECEVLSSPPPDRQGGYNSDDFRDSVNDSVECRTYHVTAAIEVTVPHCRHAGGSFPCEDTDTGAGGSP